MKAHQLPLFSDNKVINNDTFPWKVKHFSANSYCQESARRRLEEKYIPLLELTSKFNRQQVSYQLNKNADVHRWLKYKEGFSSILVEKLFAEMGLKAGETVFDPFLGSGTTAIVAEMMGLNSIGFDIMPTMPISMNSKTNIYAYDLDELKELLVFINSLHRPINYNKTTPYLHITEGAYPRENALDISYFSETIENSYFSEKSKNLAKLCILNSLESLSYTSKDGQYLRWDVRSDKVVNANKKRAESGKPLLKVKLNKGSLPAVKKVICETFQNYIDDITRLKTYNHFNMDISTSFKQTSSLIELPLMKEGIISAVVTSPPYCNRYDYTRIYALELAYLGLDEKNVRELRQSLLSCTVENKSKISYLGEYYNSIGKLNDFNLVKNVICNNKALCEILYALHKRDKNGDINNKGVITMVEGYFTELSFIYFELFRVCKSGAYIAFVNDNARYAGEVIPVDFISTEIASEFGFLPVKIYTLQQQKGNSSQQMSKYGRVPLRKSITIWKKP